MGGNGYDYRFCGILHLLLWRSEITDVTGLRKYFLYCSQPINHIGAAGSMKTVTEKAGRYLPFPKIPRKAPTKMAGAFSNARWSALRPMGPAYGRDPRDAPSLSLRLPGNAPQGRVSSASAHAGPARRTAALDGFQRSPSLRRSPDGASRAGSPSTVVRRSPWVASPRRRLNRRSPARARVASTTGSLRAGKIWIPLHGIILPPAAGGEPLRGRSRLRARKEGRDACLRSGPSAQSPRPL